MDDRNLDRLLTATLVLACALSILLRAMNPWRINHDVALYLHCAELLLDGGKPYVDFFELNPPLIMYLSTIPVGLARLLHVSPVLVTQVLVLLGVALSLGSAMVLLRRAGSTVPSVLAFANGAILCDQLVWLMDEAGQREQLFALAALPWLVHRSRRWRGIVADRTVGVLAGIVAGLFASLKPQFFLCLFAAELVGHAVARRRPSLDGDVVAFFLVPVLYAAHFALLPIEVREGFFEHVIPMIVAGYHLWDAPPLVTVWICAGTGVALLAVGLARRDALVAAMAAFVLTGTAGVWQQHKFWFYHFAPALLFAMSGVGLVLPGLLRGASAIAATVWAALLATMAYFYATSSFGEDAMTGALASRVSPGDGLLAVSADVGIPYPALVRLGLEPASRWLWLFPIPMLRAERSGTEPTPAERAFVRELAEEVETRRPRWLVVLRDVDSPVPRPGLDDFDYRAYLEETDAGRSLLAPYTTVGEGIRTIGAETKQRLEILERR